MVRWWWFGTAVEKPEILRELQQMKTDGIGGAELAFVYPEVLDDPATGLKNLPFLSPEMLDAVNYAQAEGRRLGLRIDVTLCSGWPYGGPATTLTEAAGRLRIAEVPVAPNATSATLPTLAAGESLLSASIANAVPRSANERNGGRGHLDTAPPVDWDLASAVPLSISSNLATVSPSGTARIALFFISSHTRQQVKRAAVGAEGYVLDPFSHDAVATHLKAVGEPLVKAFGATPPYAIFSDSLEAYGADWTPKLPEEFRKRRGYDLMAHLPELAAGGTPAAEKVRHDYGRTLTELVDENYLTQINEWANAHHTKFRSQTYGEPAVSFASQRLVALPEGEGPQWRAFSTLRWATSASHVFGNNVTSGETFTWLHSPVFRATPLDMKAEADIDFIMGENQLIFHGWPYSSPQAGEPGWSLYAAAVFNDHNPWHPVMPAVTKYIARMSYLLRQGQPANQVAILLPTDDAWASFTPAHVTVTGAMQKLITPALMSAILSTGYNADFIDADAINSVGLGTHQILVIPPTDRIPVETARKISAYAAAGGKIIAVGHLPKLTAEGEPLTTSTDEIALIPDSASLAKALQNAATPDVQLDNISTNDIGFIRRKLAWADIYFVANTSNHAVRGFGTLATKFVSGLQLDADTGVTVSDHVDPKSVDLTLDAYESRIFIFSTSTAKPVPSTRTPTDPGQVIADLTTNWKVTFPVLNKFVDESTLIDWIGDPATKNYSGEAVYSRDFTLPTVHGDVFLAVDSGIALPGAPNSPPEHAALGANGLPDPLVTRTGPGMHAYFDPPIHEAALVFINGQPAGALWHPPYRLDVSKLLKPGQNHIEIHVYNTALNAWSAQPPHDYKPLIAKYGDRFQMQDLQKVEPISSGILGTIHLVTESAQ
jgi:alpha-L-rhamnosidase